MGRAADPDTISRNLVSASETSFFSISDRSFQWAISLKYMVGTAINKVNRPFLNSENTASGENLGKKVQQAPDHNAHIKILIIPCTWCIGKIFKMWSSFDHSQE